jgi:hypothetical protein
MNVIDSKDALRYIATPAAHPETGPCREDFGSRRLAVPRKRPEQQRADAAGIYCD